MSAMPHALAPQSPAELVELFRGLGDGDCIRLIGTGSKQALLPAVPERDAARCGMLRLDGLRTIHRMEAADLTCSVGVGLRLDELCRALEERGVELPGTGSLLDARMGTTPTGTVGGLYATGYVTPAAPGAWTPRNTLLGFEAVLAEGLAFKAGARVVKNVAGFDLNKLFVGSRGRLFAATTLHLKLRAAPPARDHVVRAGLDEADALAVYSNLRRESAGVEAIRLERSAAGEHNVRATLSGRPDLLAAIRSRNGLMLDESDSGHAVTGNQTRVLGITQPSKARAVLKQFSAALVIDGTGGFLAHVPRDDSVSRALSVDWLRGFVPDPTSDGAFQTSDPGQLHLARRLTEALDPAGRLR